MYHATHRENVEHILAVGLRPAPDGEPVHLADEVNFAFSSAYIAHDWEDYEIAVIWVNTDFIPDEHFGPGGDGPGSHTYVNGVIGPERLSLWTS